MRTLALDVDGVLLDPNRHGDGPWVHELATRFDIDGDQLQKAFFARSWSDVVKGRRSVESGLGEALEQLGVNVDVESVLACWFDADYAPIEETFDLAVRAAEAGCRVVLATNQEHRRAGYLRRRIGSVVPLDAVLYSADIGYQKHDPEFFDLASERLGLSAEQRSSVVFVDDAIDNVEVARASGWRAVHAAPDRPWRHEVDELLDLSSSSSPE